MERRTYVKLLGGSGVSLLAGCSDPSSSEAVTPNTDWPNAIEIWRRFTRTDSEVGVILFESEVPVADIHSTLERRDGIETSDGSFQFVPHRAQHLDKDVQPSPRDIPEFRRLTKFIDNDDRYIMYRREDAVQDAELPLDLSTIDSDLAAKVVSPVAVPQRLPVSDTVQHHVSTPSGHEYVFDNDIGKIDATPTFEYPFSEEGKGKAYGQIPSPSDDQISDLLFEWANGTEPVNPLAGQSFQRDADLIIHYLHPALGAFRLAAETKATTTNKLLYGLNPERVFKDVVNSTRRLNVKAVQWAASTPIPGPGNFVYLANLLATIDAGKSIRDAATAQDVFTAATAAWDNPNDFYEDTAAVRTGVNVAKDDGNPGPWPLMLAPYDIANATHVTGLIDFGDLDVPQADNGVTWPTLFDVRQLMLLEELYFSRVSLLGQTPKHVREEYTSLLEEQVRILDIILERFRSWFPSNSVYPSNPPEDRDYSKEPYASNLDEQDVFLFKYYDYVRTQMEFMRNIATAQLEHADTLNALPTVTTDAIGETPTETPAATEESLLESLFGGDEKPTIDGLEFAVDPASSDAYKREAIVRQKIPGDGSYPVSDFELMFTGTNADGTHSLSKVTSDTSFNPGDSYTLNQETLGLNEELEYWGGSITLYYRPKDERIRVVKAEF